MKKLLIIIGILIFSTTFSQVTKNNNYPFPNYCWSGDGTTNYISLTSKIADFIGSNTGTIEFNYKSTKCFIEKYLIYFHLNPIIRTAHFRK